MIVLMVELPGRRAGVVCTQLGVITHGGYSTPITLRTKLDTKSVSVDTSRVGRSRPALLRSCLHRTQTRPAPMATTPSAHSLATLASISPRKSGAVLVRPNPTKLKQSLPPLKSRAAGAPDGRINAQKSSRMTSASSQRTLCFEPSYSGSAERSKELRRMYGHMCKPTRGCR